MPTPRLQPGHPRWPEVERAWELSQQGMFAREIGEAMGVNQFTVEHWLKVYPTRVDDPAIQAAKEAVNTNMRPTLAWAKTKNEDGTSYSVLLKPEPLPDETLDRIREAFEGMEPAKLAAPPANVMADLCTVYPLMDVHFGMLAWGRETGAQDYDISTATDDMRRAFAKVAAITPDSKSCVVLVGGDFFHADDDRAETPQSKHKLDVDGRQFKVLDRGITLIAEVLEAARAKHEYVLVRVLRGNHDPHAHMVLTFALSAHYREEPRVTVEKDPRDIFMYHWGRCLIAAHHGDRAKPQQLTLYLSDICPFWSETRHRFCFTGHPHHDRALDTGPLKWESLRAFCPPDSYASGMGYATRRAMQALTFHRQDGLILRATDPIERLE